MIVVADTSPINYLLLIGHIDLLPRLYQRVIIPSAVAVELSATDAPELVKNWIGSKPEWLDVREIHNEDSSLAFLGWGERDGIALAQSIHAHTILLDDLAARKAAQNKNLHVTGTLGVLLSAAGNGWIDLPQALANLRKAHFYIAPSLVKWALEQNRK